MCSDWPRWAAAPPGSQRRRPLARRQRGRGAGRALPGAAVARLRRGRGLGAGRRRAASPRPCCCRARPLRPGARVLDACAAPGGKTAHLLELADLDLLALDSDPLRLARVQDTLNRLRLHAELKAGDARQPATLVGRPAVRRHPARRALHRLGHRAPPPRRALAAPPRRCRRAGARPGRDAGRAVAAAGARRAPAVRHLLDLQDRGPGTDRRIFATLRRLARPRWRHSRPATCCPAATMRHSGRPGRTSALHDGFFYGLLHKT